MIVDLKRCDVLCLQDAGGVRDGVEMEAMIYQLEDENRYVMFNLVLQIHQHIHTHDGLSRLVVCVLCDLTVCVLISRDKNAILNGI